ncbi:LuxR C-terminal-related transcriptional regulator [Streptomyces sp. NPDC058955]|uniref:helix-turn-helix transcriptional regulator n=1 Tax=unclassified Streptomyces TaxID=2593676 RepID=UPI003658ABB0
MTPVRVRVVGGDPISNAAMSALLEGEPGVEVLPPERFPEARVVVAVAFDVDDGFLARIRQAVVEARTPCVRLVMVADVITEAQRAQARAYGLLHLLHRRTVDSDTVLRAVMESSGPDAAGARPHHPERRHRAAREAPSAPRETAPHPCERDVLRLLAEGLSTAEISTHLNYSERTIKGIIHRMLVRQGLRNRPHAVAHALRSRLV